MQQPEFAAIQGRTSSGSYTVENTPRAGSVTIIDGSAGGLDLATRRLLHQDALPPGASSA